MADIIDGISELPEGSALREAYEAVKSDTPSERSITGPASPAFAPSAAEYAAMPEGLKSLWGSKHSDDGLVSYFWAGGAKTFSDYEAYKRAQRVEDAVEDVMWTFQLLTENVMRDPEMSASEKTSAVAALAAEAGPVIRTAEQAAAEKAAQSASDPLPVSPVELPTIDLSALRDDDEGEKALDEDVETGSFRVFKDRDGDLRWFGVHSNNYKDRTGEIFAAESHKEYADWAMSDEGKLPTLRMWHIPVDIGDADFVGFDGTSMMSSGTFRPEWKSVAKSLSDPNGEPLGMSHGFQYRPQDLAGGVYSRYRSFEVSVLPVEAAANEFTAYFAKEAPMLSPQATEFLASKGGDSLVAAAESVTEQIKLVATEKGIEYKALIDAVFADGTKDEESAVAEAPVAAAPVATEEVEDEEKLAEPVIETPVASTESEAAPTDGEKGLTLEGIKSAMAEVVAPLQAEIDSLKSEKQTDDQRIAALLAPSTTGHRAAFSASREGEEVPSAVAEAMKIAETADGQKSSNYDAAAPYVSMLKR